MFTCPQPEECFSPENEVSEVVGDQVYREDSNICRAALHSSVIQEGSLMPQFFSVALMEGQ